MDEHQQEPEENGLTSPSPETADAEIRPTPPTEQPADVEENVTKTNVLNIQRYLRWADKILKHPNKRNKAA